ncbi:C-C motif chemokine 1 [Eulemur rufifrons]|uniref:C-C motif chemokine 1 n=1 Tax=Eulemur rufifrons TaxID=859984 RepID=UPI00374355ED
MKLIATALVCLLLAGMWPRPVDSKSMHVSSSNCCFSFVERRIPLRLIQCHRQTSSTCPYNAVIFQLKGGRQSCALKTLGWVRAHLHSVKPCLP